MSGVRICQAHGIDRCAACNKTNGRQAEAYVPIDEWAETKHPHFLENVRASVEMLSDLRGDDAYALTRAIMQFAREEFETK